MLWEQYKYRAIPVKSVLAHGWQITLLAVGRSESVKAPAAAAAREHGWCESANPSSVRELSSPASRRIEELTLSSLLKYVSRGSWPQNCYV